MTVHNAMTGYRYLDPVKRTSRKKCCCCANRATHILMADGAAMGYGCEIFGRRWVKSYESAIKSLQRLKMATSRAALERSEGCEK